MSEKGCIGYEIRKKTMSEEREVLRKGLVARGHMTTNESTGGWKDTQGLVMRMEGKNQGGELTKTSVWKCQNEI